MSLIQKAEFLAKDDSAYEDVEVPNWGTVRVRSLTGAGRDAYLQGILELQADGTHRTKTEDSEARLLALTLVDEEGKPWVLEANPNPDLCFGEDFAESAELVGIGYELLIQKLLNLGMRYQPAWMG